VVSLLGCACIALGLVSSASAEIIVELNGGGTGTVVSNPSGINCSNIGGGTPGPECSENFPLEFPPGSFELLEIELSATPNSDSFFAGWTGNDPNFFGVATCNSGDANPCTTTDLGDFGEPPITITATFEPLPDPPVVTTGSSGPGTSQYLTELEGAVNPGGSAVESCHFEYGPTTDYGFKAPCTPNPVGLGEGMVDVPVSGQAEIEQLVPNTTYHYRLVASNLGGFGKGEDQTFTTGPAPPNGDNCLNVALRETQVFGAILLPDCMALEMVSPPQKAGQPAKGPSVSVNGDRVRYRTQAGLGGTSGNLDIAGDIYVASRSGTGWTTSSTAQAGIFKGWDSFANPKSFNPDFSRWFQLGASSQQYQTGIAQAFQGELGGLFSPISPLLAPVGANRTAVERAAFQGASSDHSHLYFWPGGPVSNTHETAYLPGDLKPGPQDDSNTYVAYVDTEGQPSLELLARDRENNVWGGNCGTRLGGISGENSLVGAGQRQQGAVSSDGSRVYFSTRPDQPVSDDCEPAENDLRILVRRESEAGPVISELLTSECSRTSPPCSNDGNDFYEGASVDGTKVFLTTTRQLANSDLDEGVECSGDTAVTGCDLYLYDSTRPLGQRLIQVSAGEDTAEHDIGKEAKVYSGIASISGDGSHAYFVADGPLTDDENPEGATAITDELNLYLFQIDEAHPDGQLSFVGTLNPVDGGELGESGLWGGNGILAVPMRGHATGGDGHILPFQSRAALTPEDTDGTRRDVYQFDADAEEIRCVSCRPGGPDAEPFDALGGQIPGSLGTDVAESNRRVSEDGETVVFATAESFVPGDVNDGTDTYLWRDGELTRLPGLSTGSASLSHDGSTVSFHASSRLLPIDGDAATDIYAVRVEGGYPNPLEPEICDPLTDGSCQPSPPPLPIAPGAASVDVVGAGNVKAAPTKCPKGKRKVKRKGRVRCIPRHRNRKRQTRMTSKTRHLNANWGAGK
jgi:hypothetical protein